MIRFFDTSALVKRYVEEPGSAMARATLRAHHRLWCFTPFPITELSHKLWADDASRAADGRCGQTTQAERPTAKHR